MDHHDKLLQRHAAMVLVGVEDRRSMTQWWLDGPAEHLSQVTEELAHEAVHLGAHILEDTEYIHYHDVRFGGVHSFPNPVLFVSTWALTAVLASYAAGNGDERGWPVLDVPVKKETLKATYALGGTLAVAKLVIGRIMQKHR
jgi:hypothetical protein